MNDFGDISKKLKEGHHVLYSTDLSNNAKLEIGIVRKKLDNPNLEIPENKIRLEDGTIGYAKKILDEDFSEEIILDLIKKGENKNCEFKETFRFDVKNNCQNDNLRNEIVKEIAAFLNTSGGILIIGVSDDKQICGLERDFSLLKKKREDQTDADKFVTELGQDISSKLLNRKLENFYTIHPLVKFRDGKEICVISVEKSKIPAFVDEEKIQLWDPYSEKWKNTGTKYQKYLTKGNDTGVVPTDIRTLFS